MGRQSILNENVNSNAVNDLITHYKEYDFKSLHAVGFWVNEKGESVYSLNFLPEGKSSLTGLDILTNDDIVLYTIYNGEFNLSKINLRLNNGGDPMIKNVFDKLGKDINKAAFLLDLYVETRKGKQNFIIVLNQSGLKKYIDAIKAKKTDIEQGHSASVSIPSTKLDGYKYDKANHTNKVKEWLYPHKDNIEHVFLFWVGKNKYGDTATLMNMDPIKDDKFEGLQYLTDLDIIENDISDGFCEYEKVDILKNGNEKHVIKLFNKLNDIQRHKARLLVVLDTKDKKVISFLLNENGFKKYLRALKRKRNEN